MALDTTPNSLGQFREDLEGLGGQPTVPAASQANGVKIESVAGKGPLRQVRVRFTNSVVTIANGSTKESGSEQLLDFEPGRILFLGASCNVAGDTTDVGATSTGDFGIGTAAIGDAALATTTDNLLPATEATAAASAIDFDGGSTDSETTIIDGTSSAVDVFFNIAFDNGQGSGDVILNGTVDLTYIVLGAD